MLAHRVAEVGRPRPPLPVGPARARLPLNLVERRTLQVRHAPCTSLTNWFKLDRVLISHGVPARAERLLPARELSPTRGTPSEVPRRVTGPTRRSSRKQVASLYLFV